MLVPAERVHDPRFGGAGAYQRAVRLRVIRAPYVRRWGLSGPNEDAQARLTQAGYVGAQCRTERVFLPMPDPATGRAFYDQNYCSVPGYVGGFQVEAINNTGLQNLVDERASLSYSGSNPGYFQTYGAGNQVLQTTGVQTAASNPPATTATYPVITTLRNLSRPGAEMRVGDRWQLELSGRPSSPVTVTASHNGRTSTASFGSTDGAGRLILSGTHDNAVLGSWTQTWTIGGQSANISFTVLPGTSPPPTTGSNEQSGCPAVLKTCPDGSTVNYDKSKPGCVYLPCPVTGGGGNTGGGSGLSLESLFSKTFSFAGYEVPAWAAAAGAVGLFFMFGGRR